MSGALPLLYIKNILQNYEDNSEDLQYIEDIIEILQYYIFEGKNEIVDEDEYSDDEIFSNKKSGSIVSDEHSYGFH